MFGYHNGSVSDIDRLIKDGIFYHERFRNVQIDKDEELKDTSKKLIRKILFDRS